MLRKFYILEHIYSALILNKFVNYKNLKYIDCTETDSQLIRSKNENTCGTYSESIGSDKENSTVSRSVSEEIIDVMMK